MAVLALAVFIGAQVDSQVAFADSVIATDDFEDGEDGGTGLWEDEWEFDGDAKIYKKGGPHSGTHHLKLQRDDGRAERPADLRGEENLHLQFWAKADSFEPGETARVEVNPDDEEEAWTVLFTWEEADADNVYRFFDLEIPGELELTQEFMLAFEADMSGSNDKLYIDDVVWIAVDGPEPEPTVTPVPPTATPIPPTATAVPPTATPAPVTLPFDGFESGDFEGGTGSWNGDWDVEGADIREDDPHAGDFEARLRDDNDRIQRSADLSSVANASLQFWARVDSFENDETALVEVSPDGTNWTTLRVFTDADDDNEYQFYEFDLGEAGITVNSTIFVAFDSEMGANNDRFFVDDVEYVAAATPIPPTPTPTSVPPLILPTSTPVPTATPVVGAPFPAPPTAEIELDGEFEDWLGIPFVDDPADDANKKEGDLYRLFWANDVDGTIVFWQIERYGDDGEPFDGSNGQKKNITYEVLLDTNNDGDFDDNGDRRVRIKYHPKKNDSKVTVDVRPASGGKWTKIVKNVDYGVSDSEGGHRVEFFVTWDDLGVSFGQPIRMAAISNKGDRLPDTGDIQWSPASILGKNILIALFFAGAIAIWWFRGRHVWQSG